MIFSSIVCSFAGCAAEMTGRIRAIWKYDMPEHIRTAHCGHSPTNDATNGAPLPDKLAALVHITPLEEERLGIPTARIGPTTRISPTVLAANGPIRSRTASKRPSSSTGTAGDGSHGATKKHKSVTELSFSHSS